MPSAMQIVKTVVKEAPGLEEKIKQARLNDRRTLTKICAEAGMSTQNWYRIESGAQAIPIETLEKMQSALGVDFGVRFE